MATPRNLRKSSRETLDTPQVAVIFFETRNTKKLHFVTILNLSVQGVLVRCGLEFEKDFELNLKLHNPELEHWDTFYSRVAWVQSDPDDSTLFHVGLQFLFPVESNKTPGTSFDSFIHSKDLDFLLSSPLINRIPRESISALLNCMTRKIISPGTRFAHRFDKGGHFYIIQSGHCMIQADEETAVRKGQGDLIGEMALLTADGYRSRVVAESEMILWKLPKNVFDASCYHQPELKEFLTALLIGCIEDSPAASVRNIGPYFITRHIGEGSKSVVYKGRHQHAHFPVAIKMIRHPHAMSKVFLNSFGKTGQQIRYLNHPSIVQIIDIREKYRTLFIVMEYLDGESLKSILSRRRALPFQRAARFLTQVASALAHAHDKKIVHANLCPANIYVMDEDHIKLLDFGLASSTNKITFARTGQAPYMSPERLKGATTDHRSDIYSFGVLACELFTGRCLSSDNKAVVDRNTPPPNDLPDIKRLVAGLDKAVGDLIVKACASSPEQRYGSMHDVLEDLLFITGSDNESRSSKTGKKDETTVLLISHKKKQRRDLYRLVDDFSTKATRDGFTIDMYGKSGLT